VKHMAVMAGKYRIDSGLRALPAAEAEAQTIVAEYKAVPLAASLSALKRLLDADLEHEFDRIGGVDAVHFAGHGEFDPTKPDSSVLFLSDGQPLSSILFRSANYGDEHRPLLFLNACMIGIGGQLLGDMGGFPGNCLKGGFGGLLGALWEVDDSAAGEIAVDFWKRAMAGDPIGAILRDLRAKYVTGGGAVPVSTYLAYVYYGHPCLTLRRSA
jgi:CHAT domain-containing protein